MTTLTNAQVIAECRKEAKKNGMTFKILGGSTYAYVKRGTNESVRSNLTLGLAFDIACSGELVNYEI